MPLCKKQQQEIRTGDALGGDVIFSYDIHFMLLPGSVP